MLTRQTKIALLAVAGLGAPGHGNPLSIEGRAPELVIFARPGQDPGEPANDSGMARSVAGEIGRLEGRDVLSFVRAIAPPTGRRPVEPHPVCEVRAERDDAFARATIARDAAGSWWIAGGRDAWDDARRLSDRRMELISEGWLAYRAGFGPGVPAEPIGEVFNLEGPFTPSHIELDDRTLRARCYRSMRARIPSVDVDLQTEPFAARLPRGYDPKRPAGLLVWVTPARNWTVPRELHPALDELILVCIGALHSETERPVPDRLQLALHGAAIGQARWHIDSRRVYVTGMSGGAKMATMLWACFPDIFTGSLPIVGLASYKSAPVPDGSGRRYGAIFGRPAPEHFAKLREHRIAPISGPPDFNYVPMRQFTAGLEEDGLAIRFFEDPELAHVMPEPELFLEAIRWVDEPYQEARNAEREAARAMFEDYVDGHAQLPPTTPAQRKQLGEILHAGPWTDEAWRADQPALIASKASRTRSRALRCSTIGSG